MEELLDTRGVVVSDDNRLLPHHLPRTYNAYICGMYHTHTHTYTHTHLGCGHRHMVSHTHTFDPLRVHANPPPPSLGYRVVSLQVMSIQIKCFQEIITIGYRVYHSYELPWFRTLSW